MTGKQRSSKMNKAMYQRIRASKAKEGGFTLIELLIVIVILGILAAVVIFASAGFRNKGATESCKTNLSSIKTAVEAFHADNSKAAFPPTFVSLATYFDANGVTYGVGGATLVEGKGWNFNLAFGTTAVTGAAPAGVAETPTYTAGTGTAVVGSVCTTT